MRGVPIGWPNVAGLTLTFDSALPDGFAAFVDNQPLQAERIYRVAATDLEFSDFVGYLNLTDDEVDYEVPTIVPEVIEDYIAAHSPLTASG